MIDIEFMSYEICRLNGKIEMAAFSLNGMYGLPALVSEAVTSIFK